MSSDDKEQFKVYIPRGLSDKFRRVVSRKWGIDKYGLLSYEVGQLMKLYISVGGILPEKAHTHMNSYDNTIPTSPPSVNKVELLVNVESRTEQPQADTIGESLILRNWLMTKGVDINQSVTDADLENAHKLRSDLEYRNQWRKDCVAILEAKDRRILENNMQAKLDEQDRIEIAPTMRLIKQYLWSKYAMVIEKYDRVDRDLIYEAFKVVTSYGDMRTFNKALKSYILHDYLYLLDGKKTSYRLTDKFKEL